MKQIITDQLVKMLNELQEARSEYPRYTEILNALRYKHDTEALKALLLELKELDEIENHRHFKSQADKLIYYIVSDNEELKYLPCF